MLICGLEQLLEAYAQSVGEEGSAVPAELLQAAARIDEARAKVQQLGPSDAVASDEEDELTGGDEEVPDECAAAIDGGMHDVSPLQLWDAVMKNTM